MSSVSEASDDDSDEISRTLTEESQKMTLSQREMAKEKSSNLSKSSTLGISRPKRGAKIRRSYIDPDSGADSDDLGCQNQAAPDIGHATPSPRVQTNFLHVGTPGRAHP